MKISMNGSGVKRIFGAEKGYRALAAAGFTALDGGEPWDAYQPFSGVYTLGEEEFAAHFAAERRAIEGAGLVCNQTHAPFPTYPDPKPNLDREEEYAFMIEALKRSFVATKLLGAKVEVLHCAMRCGWGEDDDPQKTAEMNYRLFMELLPAARENGVTIALENMPLARIPSALPESLIGMIDRVGDPEYFAACLDTGHANVTGLSCREYVRALGKRLKVVHVHDNGGDNDSHRAPFTGTVDWQDFCAALREVGFAGDMNLEISMREDLPHSAYPAMLKEFCAAGEKLRAAVKKG